MNKMTALLSTIVPILVGNMATLFGYNVDGYSYTTYFFGVKSTDNLLYKAILFVVATGFLVFYVVKTSKIAKAKKTTKKTTKTTKKEVVEEKVTIPFISGKYTTKKGTKGIVITLSALSILALVGLFNWAGALNVPKTIFPLVSRGIIIIIFSFYIHSHNCLFIHII